ncbi:MAG: hypothetical protein H6839_02545 [Planctomycetes bacterium]|nr:hypothetical protein [Planctomycetota bacterium]
MAEAAEIQCPNCGSNDAVQQPRSPGMFRCNYCRTLFAPRFDMRPHVRPPEPPPPLYYPPQPPVAPQPQMQGLSSLAGRDIASRYLVYGLIAFFACGAVSPIVWLVGYREAKRQGQDPGALLILSLVFGIPVIGFGVLFLIAFVRSAIH